MKKVRLATGAAAGAVAAQALGMMVAPAAHAASPTPGTKHVHYDRHGGTDLAPNVNCFPGSHVAVNVSTHGHLRESIFYNGASCVFFQSANLNRGQTGLTERIRAWRNNFHTLVKQSFTGGGINGNDTFFYTNPSVQASNICAALVYNGTSRVAYGPVCVGT